ncbi:MAG: hypothetical protein LBF80_04460 [Spirochaetaceae bacterium]|jgi:hypothetical protein|nr:hypothetical protein [Spirochaetaceae bacterium]
MKNVHLFMLFCGFLPLISVVYGYPEEADSAEFITALAVHGLKRTKLNTAEAPLKQFIGQRADALDLDAVHAAVLDTGILEPLAIEILDGPEGGPEGKILSVSVREKWSIFPLPLLFVTSGEVNGGLFFIDANALGLNDKFFAGGMYGTDGRMLISGYMHSERRGLPGWSASASYAQSERKNSDRYGGDIRRFGLDSIGAQAGLSYSFTRALNAGLRVSYRQMTVKESDSPLAAPESGIQAAGFSAAATLRKSSWDGFLLSEETLSGSYTFTAGSVTFHEASLRALYQKSLIPGFRINTGAGFLYQPEAPALFESPPHAAQVDILPGSFSARNYAGFSAGFEKHIFKMIFGSLSARVSYQAVFSEGPILGGEADHGPAGAIVFYLSRLAIPAMALNLAYNVPAKRPQFSFSLGMSM